MKRSELLVLLVLFLGAWLFVAPMGVGFAADPTPQAQTSPGTQKTTCRQRFDKMDTNHDGVVTKDEFMAAPHRVPDPQAFFASKDTDNSGTITSQELCARKKMSCQDRFDKMDTNHDGLVSKDEFMAGRHRGSDPQAVFAAKDTDGSGTLTKDEFCSGKRGPKAKPL